MELSKIFIHILNLKAILVQHSQFLTQCNCYSISQLSGLHNILYFGLVFFIMV